MNIDSFILHLLLLAIPGYIGSCIAKTLSCISKTKKRMQDWSDLFYIIAISFISCFAYDVIGTVFTKLEISASFKSTIAILQSSNEYYTYEQFGILVLINIIIGVITAYVHNRNMLYKLGKFLKITKQYGDDDVWAHFNNIEKNDWVYIRDIKNKLTYYGYIELYSDSEERRELLISDVSVYSTDTGKELYSLKKTYLCFDYCDVSIEIPNKESTNGNNSK